MASAIEQISENEYRLKARGSEMTLKKVSDGWEMYTVNAAVMAYRRGIAIPKFFPDLMAVEKRYKSWQGIAQLAAEQ